MSFLKKLLCIVLALCICCSVACVAFADGQENSYKNYTNVFIHGLFGWGAESGLDSTLPYWGMTTGNMLGHLSAKGYNVVAASVGPISSCWDRCCELFAQLTGTRTDYGAAHCAEICEDFASVGSPLGHERYGRDYTGAALVSGWGPIFGDDGKVVGWYDNKLNLIGHSFGGPTAVYFLQLLAYGDADERAYAMAQAEENGGEWKDYCSPLFWGDYGGENLIHSVTSLAGVLNGTTFIDSCDDSTALVCDLFMALANSVGGSDDFSLYDFRLEQFGITKSDNPDYEYFFDLLRSLSFMDGKDNAIYDLSVAGCNELKQGWECFDDIFYFAYPGCATYRELFSGHQLPNLDMWPILMPFGTFMGAYTNSREIVTDIYGNEFTCIDKAWLPNDGMVNTISASYVFGCEHKDYTGEVEPGLWLTMPTYGFDHLDYGGGVIDITQTSFESKAFFDELMNNILASYSYEDKLATPELRAESIPYTTGIRLSWDKVEGATGYCIYRAPYKGGSYSLLWTTSCTGYSDLLTIPGNTYYYRITAVNRNNSSVTSAYSSVVAFRSLYTRPSSPRGLYADVK